MKIAYKKLDNVVQFPIQKTKKSTSQYALQLFVNLIALNIANNITVDIWRSLTGH
jgi:hypothetical protein